MMFVYLLSSHIYVEETSNNITFPSGLTDGHGFPESRFEELLSLRGWCFQLFPPLFSDYPMDNW